MTGGRIPSLTVGVLFGGRTWGWRAAGRSGRAGVGGQEGGLEGGMDVGLEGGLEGGPESGLEGGPGDPPNSTGEG